MAGTMSPTAVAYMNGMIDILRIVDAAPIEAFADRIFEAWEKDQKVFLFGNGGSAMTASHTVADLVKTAMVPGQKMLKAFSLVDNTGILTATGNDVSYDDTFLLPLQAYAAAGDVAVGISCSGNSPNLMKAAEWAKANGLTLVALTGFKGGKIAQIADIHINIPSDNYGIIEDLHMSVGHMAAHLLNRKVRATCQR